MHSCTFTLLFCLTAACVPAILSGCCHVPVTGLLNAGGHLKEHSAAMQNALTALEGLLPVLPQAALLKRLVRPRRVPATVLAAAASISAVAAGTPTDEVRPAVLAEMLIQPLQHPLVSPQLRNRVAALLLRVSHSSISDRCLLLRLKWPKLSRAMDCCLGLV